MTAATAHRRTSKKRKRLMKRRTEHERKHRWCHSHGEVHRHSMGVRRRRLIRGSVGVRHRNCPSAGGFFCSPVDTGKHWRHLPSAGEIYGLPTNTGKHRQRPLTTGGAVEHRRSRRHFQTTGGIYHAPTPKTRDLAVTSQARAGGFAACRPPSAIPKASPRPT